MKKRTPGLIVVLMLGLAFGLAGCSDDAPTDAALVGVDDFETMDMNLEYGGLTATDEAEAFGDDALLRSAIMDEGMEVTEDEQFGGDQNGETRREIERLRRMGEDGQGDGPHRPRFTFLRIKWGHLEGLDEVDGDLLDWTGALSVDRGIVVVRRVIRFERPFDHLVHPRINPQTVAFVSHTGGHFDGLLIEIIERPADEEGEDLEPNRLHFETGPFTQSFVVSELPGLDEIFAVEPEGNSIHFNGFNLHDLNPCPRGFLSGLWRPLADAEADTTGRMGHFRGRWVGLHGHIRGFLRGAYGMDDEGNRVFFGKYIDRAGRFGGFLGGTWEPADEESNWAAFHGQWMSRSGETEGLLGGRAFNLPVTPGGFFEGRWVTACEPEAEEMIP